MFDQLTVEVGAQLRMFSRSAKVSICLPWLDEWQPPSRWNQHDWQDEWSWIWFATWGSFRGKCHFWLPPCHAFGWVGQKLSQPNYVIFRRVRWCAGIPLAFRKLPVIRSNGTTLHALAAPRSRVMGYQFGSIAEDVFTCVILCSSSEKTPQQIEQSNPIRTAKKKIKKVFNFFGSNRL